MVKKIPVRFDVLVKSLC